MHPTHPTIAPSTGIWIPFQIEKLLLFFKKPFLEWSLYISLLFTVANLKFILTYQTVCYRSKQMHHISQAAPLTLHFKKKYWTLQSFSSFPAGVSDALRLCSEWRIQTLAGHKIYSVSLRLWSPTPQQTHSRGQIHTGEMRVGDILVLELQAHCQKTNNKNTKPNKNHNTVNQLYFNNFFKGKNKNK